MVRWQSAPETPSPEPILLEASKKAQVLEKARIQPRRQDTYLEIDRF